jgi:hypothetical protein
MKFLIYIALLLPFAGQAQQVGCFEWDVKHSVVDYLFSDGTKDFYCSCYGLNEMKSYDLGFALGCQDTIVKDKEGYSKQWFAKRFEMEIDDVKTLKVVEIDGASGIEIVHKYKNRKTKRIMYYYQLVVFRSYGNDQDMRLYTMSSVIYGDHAHNLNSLREIAKSMKLL